MTRDERTIGPPDGVPAGIWYTFLRLWTKAAAADRYDKDEWKRLASWLRRRPKP